ncbi:glycosyltransferase [Nostoc calcicola FACHB-3891]|nr:glycosyltransferase [Nostoc calcicola FACHB-3891]
MISIIISSFNRRKSLEIAIITLLKQRTDVQFEIIVVLDGSNDGSIEMLNLYPSVNKIIFYKNQGAAISLNAGSRIAFGDILLFLDDDMRFDENLVNNHFQYHLSNQYDVIIGHFPLDSLPHSSFFREVIYDWTEGWQLSFNEDVSFFDSLCSGHFSIKKELFFKVGGFDEQFSRWGRKDSELGYRLIKAGAKFAFYKEAKAYQNYEKKPSQFLDDYKLLGIADVELVDKHSELKKDLLLSCFYQAPWFILKLRYYLLNNSSITKVFIDKLSNLLDNLHNQKIYSKYLEGILWAVADYKYWEGVLDKLGNRKQFDDLVGNPLSILLYHRIADDNSKFSVSSICFKEQMEYLFKNNYNVVSLETAVNFIQNKHKIPKKTVVITFDDGYKDFWKAFEIVNQYRFPVTVFIPTFFIGSVNGWKTEEMPNSIPLLAIDEIKYLHSKGVSFQAHGHSHIPFEKLSEQEFYNELKECRSKLLSIDINAKYLAYPSGSFTQRTKLLLKKFGFEAGLTCISTLTSSDSDLFEIPRISVDNSDINNFKMQLDYGIGYSFAVSDFFKHLIEFKPAKYWHNLKYDKNCIFVYSKKRKYHER